MTTPPRKPKRNKGGGKLGAERVRAGVGAPGGGPTGIHSLDPEEGELFEHDPEDITPNPMNRRLDLRNMDEMIASVRRQGVHTPGAVMHTKLFVEMYPEWAGQVEFPNRTYILGPGHRRHAAALAAGKPMLAILRDRWAKDRRVEENLISENNDRDDLSPIEQALQLDLLRQRELTGEEIAERSGYGSRGTVSKILSLLALPQQVRDEIHAGNVSAKAGYVLARIKDDHGKNDSPEAHSGQLTAFGWMQDEGLSADAAKNRLELTAAGFPAGNTEETPVPPAPARPEPEPGTVSRGKQPAPPAEGKRGAADAVHAEPPIPHQTSGPEEPADQAEEACQDPVAERRQAAREAASNRDLACRLLLREEKYAGAAEVTGLLVDAVLSPGAWAQAAKHAHRWLSDLGRGPAAAGPEAYFQAVAAGRDAHLKRRCAFAIALAANELRAAQADREWDDRDRAHLELLMTGKAAYRPTEYERGQLGRTTATGAAQ